MVYFESILTLSKDSSANCELGIDQHLIHFKTHTAAEIVHHYFPLPILHNDGTSTVESVQDFLIKLDMEPCMQLVEISIPILQAKFYYIPPLEGIFQTFWGIDI